MNNPALLTSSSGYGTNSTGGSPPSPADPVLHDGAVGTVLGSCVFSDPNTDNNLDSIIIATNTGIKSVALASGVISTYAYPNGVTLPSDKVELLQAFDKVMLLRPKGNRSFEWDGLSAKMHLIPSGNDDASYVQPVIFGSTGNYSATSGLVTITDSDGAKTLSAPIVIATEIVLSSGSSIDGYYVGSAITIVVSGTTYNYTVVGYTGSTKTLVVFGTTDVPAGATTIAGLIGDDIIGSGSNLAVSKTTTASGVSTTTLVLPALFDDNTSCSSVDGIYTGNIIINGSLYSISTAAPYIGATRTLTLATPVPTDGSFTIELLRPAVSLTVATGAGTHITKKIYLSDSTGFISQFSDGSYPSQVDGFYNGSGILATFGNTTYTLTLGNYVAATGSMTYAVTAHGITGYVPTTGTATISMGSGSITFYTHGVAPGDIMRVSAISTGNALTIDQDYTVAFTPSYDTFQFYADVPDVLSTAPQTVTLGKPQSLGLGFTRQPAPPWAVYFQRRLWCPYLYEVGGTNAAPIFTDRGIKDEIIVSDILDSNTFDAIQNQLRVTAGISDYLVAMQPFVKGDIFILNRNSIHLATGADGSITSPLTGQISTTPDLSNLVIKQVTGEAGCLARKSVIICGSNLYFLSDNGVYGLEYDIDYTVYGIKQPLSLEIQPLIDRINKTYAPYSVAAFFDNRYWLAVPLDSAVGANDAVYNNAILVYNFLNKAWESVDTFPTGFDIMNLHVGKSSSRNDLYAVSNNGGVHKLNAVDSSIDTYYTSDTVVNTGNVGASLKSRYYTMGDNGTRKRFVDYQVQMVSPNSSSNGTLGFVTENPSDNIPRLNSISALLADPLGISKNGTANLRVRVGGLRGYAGGITFKQGFVTSGSLVNNSTLNIGRPKIVSMLASASITNRSTISQK